MLMLTFDKYSLFVVYYLSIYWLGNTKCDSNLQVNYSRHIRPDMKTHLDRPLVVENRNNNTNKTTANNSDLCFSQHHPTDELHMQACLHEHSGQVGGGGGGGSSSVRPPLERGESTDSRRSRKSEHHRHRTSHVPLDSTVIPGPGSQEKQSRCHHHTRSGSRGGGQSEHRKPRSHRKTAEDGEGGARKTERHKSRGADQGGEGVEQEGAGDGSERQPRRNRHDNQVDGKGKRMCQHRRRYVQCTWL